MTKRSVLPPIPIFHRIGNDPILPSALKRHSIKIKPFEGKPLIMKKGKWFSLDPALPVP